MLEFVCVYVGTVARGEVGASLEHMLTRAQLMRQKILKCTPPPSLQSAASLTLPDDQPITPAAA